jgi:hypothetical protein
MGSQPADPLNVPLEEMNVASGLKIWVVSFIPATSVQLSISEKKWSRSSCAGLGTVVDGHEVEAILDDMVESSKIVQGERASAEFSRHDAVAGKTGLKK